MLAIARGKTAAAEFVEARAEAIPFPDASFDFVACTVAFHHFEDKERACDEIARVMRPGGCLELNNVEPYRCPRWWPYVLFPESRAIDEVRFWPADRLTAALERRGFGVSSWGSWWTGRARVADKLPEAERRTLSQLATMDDADYERRLAAMKARIAAAPEERIVDETAFMTYFATKT
jgi:ubiquinone/menaquinone biosynthesis C-methylase UbiE